MTESEPGVISPKLAKALSSPWRTRIITEASLRPISPSEFVRQIGGERTHVSRCFRQLAEWNLIELVETRRGGSRRGGVEHVYRAVRPAKIDTGRWEGLPLLLREGISVNILGSYSRRFSDAIGAGLFDAEPGHRLSTTRLTLDRQAWNQLIGRLDDFLESFPALAAEVAERLSARGGTAIPVTIGLLAYRSPAGSPKMVAQSGAGHTESEQVPGASPDAAISAKMAKALANPWRAQILVLLRNHEMSPSQFVAEVGGELDQISRCFRQLAKWGYLEVAERRRGEGRRGGTEHIYRAVPSRYFPSGDWMELRPPASLSTAAEVVAHWDAVSAALVAGTFDLEVDRHLSWDGPILDDPSLQHVSGTIDEIQLWLPELEAEALARMAVSGEEAIPTTVGLACFRSPAPPGEG